MVNDATKKFREPIAFALLAVSALWFISALGVLFKGADAGFATRAALTCERFASPIAVVSLVVAVLLVTRFDGPSRNARIVVLAALGVAGLDLLFGVITYFAQFDANLTLGYMAVPLAGKVVGAFAGLAVLLFLAAATLYLVTALQGLPAPEMARGWASYGPGGQQGATPQQGWGPQPGQGYQQPPPGQGYQQPAPGQGYQQSPSGWGQPPAPYGWGGQSAPGQQSWSGAGTPGWGQAPTPGGWEQPGQAQSQQGQSQQGQPDWGRQTGPDPSAGQRPWQWAQEPTPPPSPWIQPTPTYGEAPTSAVETPADPVWTQPDYGAPTDGPRWGQPEAPTAWPESAAEPVQDPEPALFGSEEPFTHPTPVEEPVGGSAYDGDDDTVAPTPQAGADEVSPDGDDAPADPDQSTDSGSGWWRPSQS